MPSTFVLVQYLIRLVRRLWRMPLQKAQKSSWSTLSNSNIQIRHARIALPAWYCVALFNSLMHMRHWNIFGQPVIFTNGFPTPSGRGKFVPAEYVHADELPNNEYPLVFIAGHQLEHWHTGIMTRHSATLDAIEPDPVVSLSPEDLKNLGVAAGTLITIESRRGKIAAYARSDNAMQKRQCLYGFLLQRGQC